MKNKRNLSSKIALALLLTTSVSAFVYADSPSENPGKTYTADFRSFPADPIENVTISLTGESGKRAIIVGPDKHLTMNGGAIVAAPGAVGYTLKDGYGTDYSQWESDDGGAKPVEDQSASGSYLSVDQGAANLNNLNSIELSGPIRVQGLEGDGSPQYPSKKASLDIRGTKSDIKAAAIWASRDADVTITGDGSHSVELSDVLDYGHFTNVGPEAKLNFDNLKKVSLGWALAGGLNHQQPTDTQIKFSQVQEVSAKALEGMAGGDITVEGLPNYGTTVNVDHIIVSTNPNGSTDQDRSNENLGTVTIKNADLTVNKYIGTNVDVIGKDTAGGVITLDSVRWAAPNLKALLTGERADANLLTLQKTSVDALKTRNKEAKAVIFMTGGELHTSIDQLLTKGDDGTYTPNEKLINFNNTALTLTDPSYNAIELEDIKEDLAPYHFASIATTGTPETIVNNANIYKTMSLQNQDFKFTGESGKRALNISKGAALTLTGGSIVDAEGAQPYVANADLGNDLGKWVAKADDADTRPATHSSTPRVEDVSATGTYINLDQGTGQFNNLTALSISGPIRVEGTMRGDTLTPSSLSIEGTQADIKAGAIWLGVAANLSITGDGNHGLDLPQTADMANSVQVSGKSKATFTNLSHANMGLVMSGGQNHPKGPKDTAVTFTNVKEVKAKALVAMGGDISVNGEKAAHTKLTADYITTAMNPNAPAEGPADPKQANVGTITIQNADLTVNKYIGTNLDALGNDKAGGTIDLDSVVWKAPNLKALLSGDQVEDSVASLFGTKKDKVIAANKTLPKSVITMTGGTLYTSADQLLAKQEDGSYKKDLPLLNIDKAKLVLTDASISKSAFAKMKDALTSGGFSDVTAEGTLTDDVVQPPHTEEQPSHTENQPPHTENQPPHDENQPPHDQQGGPGDQQAQDALSKQEQLTQSDPTAAATKVVSLDKTNSTINGNVVAAGLNAQALGEAAQKDSLTIGDGNKDVSVTLGGKDAPATLLEGNDKLTLTVAPKASLNVQGAPAGESGATAPTKLGTYKVDVSGALAFTTGRVAAKDISVLDGGVLTVNKGATLSVNSINLGGAQTTDSFNLTKVAGTLSAGDGVAVAVEATGTKAAMLIGGKDLTESVKVKAHLGELKGATVAIDPAFVDHDGKAIAPAEAQFTLKDQQGVAQLDGNLVVGQNAKVVLGEGTFPASALPSTVAIGDPTHQTEGTTTVGNAVYVAAPLNIAATGSLVVDPSKNFDTAANVAEAKQLQPAAADAGKLLVAANGLLALDADSLGSNKAFITTTNGGSIDGAVALSHAKLGVKYTVATGNVALGQDAKAFVDSKLLIPTLTADNNGAVLSTNMVDDVTSVFPKNSLVNAKGVNAFLADLKKEAAKPAPAQGGAPAAPKNVYDTPLVNMLLNASTSPAGLAAFNNVQAATAVAALPQQTMGAQDAFISAVEDNNTGADKGLWAHYVHQKQDYNDIDLLTGNASGNRSSNGIVVGADVAKSDSTVLGVAASYAKGDSTTESPLLGTKDDNHFYGVGLYGRHVAGEYTVSGDLSYSHGSHDLKVYSGDQVLADSLGTNALSLGLRLERTRDLGDGNAVTPYVGLRYTHLGYGDFTSSGLTVKTDSANVVSLPIGVKFTAVKHRGAWTVAPTAELAFKLYLGGRDVSTTSLIGGQSASQSTSALPNGYFAGKLGLTMSNGQSSYSIAYDYNNGSGQSGHQYMASARYKF